jgi:PAS domain S-box-containing protein
MAIDVTEVEKLSEELIRQARFRHVLTESVLDALLASDASGTITLFNTAAEKLLGKPASEVIGHSKLSDFLPPEFDKALAASTEGILLPDTTVTNARWEEIPVRLSGTVLTEKEKIIGTSVFLQDLREYKKLERENLDNERLAAVGQTVAQLAHGIKNILTGLQGGMYVTRSGIKRGSTERMNKGWNMLERNIERITILVKGFLGFSKGHIPEVKPTDPNKVAEDVFNLYKDAALEKGITMTYHPKVGIPEANMDQEDLHACLENLVSNALDSCQVSSENDEQTIAITVGDEDGVLFYEVADNGCGMDYEVKKKVFTTFFTTKGLGGTGLGLLVTRKIVQEHGGKISVESTPGKGSVFSIRLPRKRLPALPEGSEPA